MRILHVISSPATGGAEIYVKDLTIELKSRGHYVAVGFLEHAKDVGRSEEYESLFISELDALSIPYFFIGHDTRKKPWLGALRIRQYIKKNNIDIYHTHLPYGVVFSSLLNIPCIYTHHTIMPRMSMIQYKIFNILLDRYVGISKKCSESLKHYTGKSVTTIFNGVNLEKIKTQSSSASISKAKITAITVGRIHPDKNYKFLVDAISRLPQTTLSIFKLKIAGEGPKEETNILIEYIKKKKLSDVIELLGNRDNIPDLLAQSDIFLMSSEQEGLPIALIEAAATGLPCLVTNVGGCYEIIEICNNGYVIDLDNIQGYVDKLNELILNNDLRDMLSNNAKSKGHLLGIEQSASKHIVLYESLIKV